MGITGIKSAHGKHSPYVNTRLWGWGGWGQQLDIIDNIVIF